MEDKELIEEIKKMYKIENGNINRIEDCSKRGYVSHSDCSKDIIQMKIKIMNTRDIVYIVHFGVIPNGRVIYKDGNRLNFRKDNIDIVETSEYFKAVNLALTILSESKEVGNKNDFKNPKELMRYITSKGIESMGVEQCLSIVKNSKLERVQQGRATKSIRYLSCIEWID